MQPKPKTAAERKAAETKRKAEQGLIRRSFWVDAEIILLIEAEKKRLNCTADEALASLLKAQACKI